MVRDAIFNINTYFVTHIGEVGFGSLVVRREIRNPKIPGSNPSTTIRSFFFFFLSFLFSFSYYKIID